MWILGRNFDEDLCRIFKVSLQQDCYYCKEEKPSPSNTGGIRPYLTWVVKMNITYPGQMDSGSFQMGDAEKDTTPPVQQVQNT